MTPRALVIETQADAPAGRFTDWAAARGVEIDVARADLGELPEPAGYDCAVALGSSATARGVGLDWVAREIEWLRAADAAGVAILGICFGAHALAAALGGAVHRLEKPEVGWVSVESNDPARVPPGPWMAWHEDRIELPPLAYELASNRFGVQAFCHRRHLAVQFHPEVTVPIIDRWSETDHRDFARAGTTREAVVAGTRTHAATAARSAEILFDGFAARAALVAVASRS